MSIYDDPPQKRERVRHPRSPWTWPLVALAILLFLVIGGTVVALAYPFIVPQ